MTYLIFPSLMYLITCTIADGSQNNQISFQLVGQIGGPTQGVAVQGNYAYVGVGLRLIVLDVSNPASLREVGATTPFPYFVEDVAVSGNLAYVAAGGAGLRVVDISDPTHPAEVGAWDSMGYAEGVAVAGNIVYLADGPYGLRIVDVSNPAQPNEVGFAFPMNYAFKVAVDGQYAYIAAAGAGLLIADVSDPTHPVEVGTYDTPGYAYGVAVSGNTVYIADGWEGLRIVNVTDPTHPVQIGSYKTPGWAFGVTISGNIAYVADAFKGLRVLDISRPSQLTEVGSFEISGGHANGLALAASTVFIADRNLGLRAIRISNPKEPVEVGFFRTVGIALHVVVVGQYAYLASSFRGLQIVDISKPGNPMLVGTYDTKGNAVGVAIAGNYAYVAVNNGNDSSNGLHVVDISNPAKPVRSGFFLMRGGPYPVMPGRPAEGEGVARGMEIAGSIAYVANEWGLLLINIANPVNPTYLGQIRFDWESGQDASVDVAVSGGIAYVAKEKFGLGVIDVSDPRSPYLIGFSDLPWNPQGVAVSGKQVFVADPGNRGTGNILVYDVTHPAQPTLTSSYTTPGSPARLTIDGSLVYVADGNAGVQVLDVSDASHIVPVSSFDTPGYATKVAIEGTRIYVADGISGLLIEEQADVIGKSALAATLPVLSESPAMNGFEGYSDRSTFPSKPLRAQPHTFPSLSDVAPGVRPSKSLASSHTVMRISAQSAVGFLSSPFQESNGSCVVNTVSDSGPGSLRSCIENATARDMITFSRTVFPPDRPAAIRLASPLPFLNQGNLTIDASDFGVILEGSGLTEAASGLVIMSSNNIIKGLQIRGFTGNGIAIGNGAQNNIIGGNRMRGSGPTGEGNLISDNGSGIIIAGQGTDNNIVTGNLIGTDASGTTLISNRSICIFIGAGAQGNTIGGSTSGEGNLICGCGGMMAIQLSNSGTMYNTVVGNRVGTDISGMRALGDYNSFGITDGATNNRIGGAERGEGNLISGSNWVGIYVLGVGTSANAIVGNYIGTNAIGTAAIPNLNFGVNLDGGATSNLVHKNLISGNATTGIGINNWGTDYNVISGNLIGTDASGTVALGNDGGVLVNLGARFNRIGGTESSDRNIISGNMGWGNVCLGDRGTENNILIGNYIGTDVTGAKTLHNVLIATVPNNGINIGDGSLHNFIGGMSEGERNVVAGNQSNGINIEGGGVEYNFILGNCIGTDKTGTDALANLQNGIRVEKSGRIIIQANTVAHNNESGVRISGSAHNSIRRNSIYGNNGSGISLVNQGNKAIPVPIITTANTIGVLGTACPGCTIEFFSDAEDEGRVYEGTTVADASGAFTFNKGSPLIGPNITATATDRDGNTSEFSTPKTISETISTPENPSGPATGTIGANYRYSTSGSSSNLGHSIQYFFDWGDGTNSGWLPVGATTASKSWNSPGPYPIKVQARCATDTSVVSIWSNILTVTITSTPRPDLTGSWTTPVTQTCRNTKKGLKCTIKGILTVNNVGNADASSTSVDFYLSDDTTIDEGENPFKQVLTGKIKKGKSKKIALNYNLLLGVIASSKYIIAVIDKNNLVMELDESNNNIIYGPIP